MAGHPDNNIASSGTSTQNLVPGSSEDTKGEGGSPYKPSAGSAVSRRMPHLHKLEK